MSERPSFWQRLFGRTGSSSLSPRQQKVSDYIIARMENDVPLRQLLEEDYVRRNSSQAEIERIVSSPEFIETIGAGEGYGPSPLLRLGVPSNFGEKPFHALRWARATKV